MDFNAEIKIKYPHMEMDDIKGITNRAKAIYYSLRYPCEPNACEKTRPLTTFKAQQWIIMACDDIIARYGFNNATGYSENGVHFTFDGAEISERLISMVKPIIGVLK
jgi:hypothetical protein